MFFFPSDAKARLDLSCAAFGPISGSQNRVRKCLARMWDPQRTMTTEKTINRVRKVVVSVNSTISIKEQEQGGKGTNSRNVLLRIVYYGFGELDKVRSAVRGYPSLHSCRS